MYTAGNKNKVGKNTANKTRAVMILVFNMLDSLSN